MAIQGPFKINFGDVFPQGCGVVSVVTPAYEYVQGAPKGAPKVQARDKATGVLIWHADVMDFDPESKGDRTFRVKIISEVQPVPPDALPGVPIRPVVLDGMTVTPYLQDGQRPRVAYSVRCTGLLPVQGSVHAASGKAAA